MNSSLLEREGRYYSWRGQYVVDLEGLKELYWKEQEMKDWDLWKIWVIEKMNQGGEEKNRNLRIWKIQ